MRRGTSAIAESAKLCRAPCRGAFGAYEAGRGGALLPSSKAMEALFDVVSDEKLLCLERLGVGDSKVQQDAAAQLRECVEGAARELSTESFDKFEAEVHQRVFDLLSQKVSPSAARRSCGLFLLLQYGGTAVCMLNITYTASYAILQY